HEERKAPRQREDERGETENVSAAAAGPLREHEDSQRDDCRDPEKRVAAELSPDRRQEALSRTRETGEVGRDDVIEKSAGRRREERDRVRESGEPQQDLFDGARAPHAKSLHREAGEQREAERRQKVELDGIAEPAKRLDRVEQPVEGRREAERQDERD